MYKLHIIITCHCAVRKVYGRPQPISKRRGIIRLLCKQARRPYQHEHGMKTTRGWKQKNLTGEQRNGTADLQIAAFPKAPDPSHRCILEHFIHEWFCYACHARRGPRGYMHGGTKRINGCWSIHIRNLDQCQAAGKPGFATFHPEGTRTTCLLNVTKPL